MSNFLELHHISKRFGGVQALADVDLAVATGEVHCLIGENGSGKSTLIKIIAGVAAPDAGGEIVIEGKRESHLTAIRSTELGIQVIYQDLSLFPNLTVAENIGIFHHLGRPHAVRRRRIRDTADAAMAQLRIKLDPDALVGELPVASRQLVAICRAMAAKARFLIMDEPTASLTRREVETLLALTLELRRHGVTVVFVSHQLKEIMAIAERVSVLRDGTMLGTFAASDMDDRRLAVLMTGKEFAYQPPRAEAADAPPVLQVRDLRREGEYDDVSFALHRGEILGITGRLGAGRSELALSLFGMTRPDGGDILMHGKPLRLGSNRDADRARHRLCAGGPADAGAGGGAADRGQHHRHRARQPAARAGPDPGACARGGGRTLDPQPRDQGAECRARGAHALRRQPAAGGAVEMAGDPAQGADPRHARPPAST